MPVYKFNSYEAAEQALWNFNPGPAYFRRIHELFVLAEKLNKPECKRGVFRFSTFSEAQGWRMEQEIRQAKDKINDQSQRD